MTGAWCRQIVCGVAAVTLCWQATAASAPDVPYVPTPMHVVDAMLDLGGVGPGDFLMDLGSGDGRIAIRAATRFGTRGMGVDLDDNLVRTARADARQQGVQDKVSFEVRNLFDTDVSRATVVTSYLFNSVNMRLRPQLFAQLRPGTRIVTHDFSFGNWEPDRKITIDVPDKPYGPPRSDIMLWVVPADFSGAWQWEQEIRGATVRYGARIAQKFQKIEGEGTVGGQPLRLTDGQVRGDGISFTLTGAMAGKPVRWRFTGRISGDAISGQMVAQGVAQGGAPSLPWRAVRKQAGKMDISGDTALRVAVGGFDKEQ